MFPPQLPVMAAALTVLLCCCLHAIAAAEPNSKKVQPQEPPHLTGCVSTNMETFCCSWSVGAFQNLSDARDLRLFYLNQNSLSTAPKEWRECPEYSTETPHQCFFNKEHTTIWTQYGVQLRSGDRAVLYDELFFYVQDIVEPDPPVGLNWTLLNVSLTGTHFDIMVNWRPPESADVKMGWMTLSYEVQHRSLHSDHWEVTDLVSSTHRTLYGLQTNVNHEVRVRCKMHGMTRFGGFSDSAFVHIQSKVWRFPVVALLVVGALCLVAILMLVIISQQEKLMVVLLPPVPEPKIKGVDSQLLKKGKLQEFSSVLGGPPDLRPELYSDPWVEFIDLDMEQQSDRLTCLDTDCLMDSSNCSPLSAPFRDHDSGRSSCCEQDLLCDPNASPDQILPNEATSQPDSHVGAGVPSLGRDATYTQVSEVRSGNVMLSPEEQVEEEEGRKEAADGKCYGLPPTAAPAYTVVDGIDAHNSLLLTPNSTSSTAPKTLPAPGSYLIPDLLSSITP
ncbi:Growth hormone receptor [Oryzias melastigma]|uniref:Growth hormone receptor n=1 Tax=Oryzias melastigma TaxID=30732 RepID=A0A834CPR4_ORYME|nr:Growth hormone receptor [Oryzias melastigma]